MSDTPKTRCIKMAIQNTISDGQLISQSVFSLKKKLKELRGAFNRSNALELTVKLAEYSILDLEYELIKLEDALALALVTLHHNKAILDDDSSTATHLRGILTAATAIDVLRLSN